VRSLRRVEVFAVGTGEAQLIVRRHKGSVVSLAGTTTKITHDVQSIRVGGLTPGAKYPISMNGRAVAHARTLPAVGPLRSKVATISDLHVGETGFAFLPRRMSSADPARGHPITCLRAAIAEINAWGPDLVVAKGDLAHRPNQVLYDLLAEAFAELTAPLVLIPGNHDGGNRQGILIGDALGIHGFAPVMTTDFRDLPGARVIVLNSVKAGLGSGWLDETIVDDVLTSARTDRPLLVFAHHQLMRRSVAYYWPPGVPSGKARPFLDRLAEANQSALISSGHTHRHRRWNHGPLVVTEVGSTKDHPGTWASYEVYDDAVAQSVWRIGEPAALAWTESVANAVGGVWGHWSSGRRSQRCFVHTWPGW
jgi:3',5'-cyclic-AMP phosphodiesterase